MAVESLAVNPITSSHDAAQAEPDNGDTRDRKRQPAADRSKLHCAAGGEDQKTDARDVEPMLRYRGIQLDDIGDGKESRDEPDRAQGTNGLRSSFAQSA